MMNKENIFKHFKVGYKGDYSLGIEVEVKEYSGKKLKRAD